MLSLNHHFLTNSTTSGDTTMTDALLWLYATIQWRHNERNGISNHRRLNCLLDRLFRRRSNKHQSSVSLAFVRGIHRWPVNSLHKGPARRKMFPFDDVIMKFASCVALYSPSKCPRDWGNIAYREISFIHYIHFSCLIVFKLKICYYCHSVQY